MRVIENIYVKAISMFLAACFIFVFVLNDYSYASEYVSGMTIPERVDLIDIPIEYGKVLERYDASGSTGKQVILIQDLHANYEAQSNIRRILEHIDGN